jgi:putative transposase
MVLSSKCLSTIARVRGGLEINQRNDFQHKLSRELVNHHGFIAVEDLNGKGLAGGMLAKSVQDAAWSSFIAKLS